MPKKVASYPTQLLITTVDSQQTDNDLLSYGQYLQWNGNASGALEIYAAVAQRNAEHLSAAASPTIRQQAIEQIRAIEGGGAFSRTRAEFLADSFMEQILDPALLGAMVGAGLTYRAARFGLQCTALRLRVRSAYLPAVSSFVAIGAEAASFPLFVRLGNLAQGRNVDWSPEGLIHDIQSSFLILGGLKVFGAFGSSTLRWWEKAGRVGGPVSERLLRTLVPQTAMYLGTISGSQAEQWFGLTLPTTSSQLLLDSLRTLLHFNAAGSVLRAGTPRSIPPFHRPQGLFVVLFNSFLPASLRLQGNEGLSQRTGSQKRKHAIGSSELGVL